MDANVTRHLDDELARTDWTVMILHYLGLDHIGHTAGPKSPLVAAKLREMDAVVERIHRQSLQDAGRTVLILCGDHGRFLPSFQPSFTVEMPEFLVSILLFSIWCDVD